MDHSIVRRIRNGFGASLYGQAIIAAIQLIGVPILLYAWGVHLYGEWLILFAIPSYLSMADLGFSQSAANDMTARMARGDKTGTLTIFQSLTALIYFAIALGLMVATLLVVFMPLQKWIHFAGISITEVRWVLWLLSVEVLVRLADGVNNAGFRSHGDYALYTTVFYSTMLLQQVALWISALSGHSLIAAAALFTLVRAAATPSVAFWLVRRHRGLTFGFTNTDRNQLRSLIKPALANISMPLAMALNIQGMILIIGAMLGPIAVVTFTALRTLTRLAVQMVAQAAHAFEPELAAAWGKQDHALLVRLYTNTLRIGFWLALVAAGSLAIFGTWILRIWTHGEVPMNVSLFRWLLLSALASALWYDALHLLKASNTHLRAALLYVFSAGSVIALAALLLSHFHRLSDAGMSLLLMDGVMATYLTRRTAKTLGLSEVYLLASMLDPRPLFRNAITVFQIGNK